MKEFKKDMKFIIGATAVIGIIIYMIMGRIDSTIIAIVISFITMAFSSLFVTGAYNDFKDRILENEIF